MDGLAATAAAVVAAAGAAPCAGCKPADPIKVFSACRGESEIAFSKTDATTPFTRTTERAGSSSMKVRLLLGLQLLLLGVLSVGGVTIAPLRRSMALGVLRKLVDLEKVGAR